MDGGELFYRVELLRPVREGAAISYRTVRRTWANIEFTAGKNLFSSVGLGVKSAELLLRKQEIDLSCAIRWRGKHLFLTDIVEQERRYLKLSAARVEPTVCAAYRMKRTLNERRNPVDQKEPLLEFPGFLTEKFEGYARDFPMAKKTERVVIVTPKLATLEVGDLVEFGRGPYCIEAAYRTDEWKNEYEAVREADV